MTPGLGLYAQCLPVFCRHLEQRLSESEHSNILHLVVLHLGIGHG